MELEGLKPATSAKRGVGRPRRLNLDAIVDAACEIGLASLEMGLVAERLNTGVATLYGYVRGREHLLELVVERLASRVLVIDTGQSWQDVLREHSAAAFAVFETLPHLITNLLDTTPDAREGQYVQAMLEMLERRGLSHAVAADLYIEVNQAVIGAAVSLARRKRIPACDQNGKPVVLPAVWGDYRPTMERIIADMEVKLSAEA